ncbi:MAG: acyl-CoA thioesterase [Cyanobacterium sp. T60_A2020_053]|nr:acyl-CoA thioesterase [Cyanobacterium sp. T60_A2020_053]
MIFAYQRPIHFADTDSAGVVYFARLLSICHEAYENYLTKKGINLREFFNNNHTAIPIIHAEIDFFYPVFCGDIVIINSKITKINDKVFQIDYLIKKEEENIGKGMTKHICINPQTRKTKPFPAHFSEQFFH